MPGVQKPHCSPCSEMCIRDSARVGVRTDAHQPRQAIAHCHERFAADERVRAAAADPSVQLAVGGDHGLVAGMRRRRRLRANHGCECARTPRRGVLGEQVHQSVVYSVTPLLRSAAHTLLEVIGMSMLVMPRCDSASITALTYAAGDPTAVSYTHLDTDED